MLQMSSVHRFIVKSSTCGLYNPIILFPICFIKPTVALIAGANKQIPVMRTLWSIRWKTVS